HQPRRPMLAKIRPGRPAPAMGPGGSASYPLPKAKARWPEDQHALVKVLFDVVDQTIFRRLRRAKPTSPPQAITSPGSPAPTTGPGTCETAIGPVRPPVHWG